MREVAADRTHVDADVGQHARFERLERLVRMDGVRDDLIDRRLVLSRFRPLECFAAVAVDVGDHLADVAVTACEDVDHAPSLPLEHGVHHVEASDERHVVLQRGKGL
jgi:hypothetical protein